MTTLSDIYQKTKQLLEENADTNSDIDTKLHFSSYIRDSIQFIKIVICLEDEYDIEFDNQDLQLEKYKSIDDFIQMIYQKRFIFKFFKFVYHILPSKNCTP